MRIQAFVAVLVPILALAPVPALAQYLGNLTANPYAGSPAAPQPPGTFSNPYGTGANSPKLFNDSGAFRGNLNANRFDQNSVANPYGRYGSPFSADSINNPYGQGSPFRQDSPSNPHGHGLRVYR
jgi:hypothetical protein